MGLWRQGAVGLYLHDYGGGRQDTAGGGCAKRVLVASEHLCDAKLRRLKEPKCVHIRRRGLLHPSKPKSGLAGDPAACCPQNLDN